MDSVLYTAPVSGEVVDVKRGAKRKLLEIVILADKDIEYETFKSYPISDLAAASREELQEVMLKSGVWPNIIQRPYGVVANPADTPRDIFISGFDSSPLAPDYSFILKGQERNFQAGVEVLKKFTTGTIHVNIDGNGEVNPIYNGSDLIQQNKIYGQHPAGNVGVQSSAIIVQGLANDDVKGSVNGRLIKEMLLAALNGAILAVFRGVGCISLVHLKFPA